MRELGNSPRGMSGGGAQPQPETHRATISDNVTTLVVSLHHGGAITLAEKPGIILGVIIVDHHHDR